MNKNKFLPIIKYALKEDIGKGDITTEALLQQGLRAKALIAAKEAGVVAGIGIARLVFKEVDKALRIVAKVRDGQKVKSGAVIFEIFGSVSSILKAERTALNFLGRLSGIATLTAEFVERVKPYKVKIMDTRKTTPGLRIFEKFAVKCGNGFNHRMGLYDMVLVKENHIKSQVTGHKSQDLRWIVREIRRKVCRGTKIEVEVENLKEFREVLEARPDIIMLDNFTIKDVKSAVKIFSTTSTPGVAPPGWLEVSGNITLNNVRKYAAAGIDRISIGTLTHSPKAMDFSLRI